MTPSLRTRHLRANGALLFASALWGFAFVAQRVGAEHVGPFSFNSVRFALGAACLVPVIAFQDRRRRLTSEFRRRSTAAVVVPGLLAGLFLTIAVSMQQVALAETTAGNAAFITGFYMVFVPVIAAFRGHRTNLLTILGIAAALSGLYLISVQGDFTVGRGDALVLLSTLFWAGQILLVEHYSQRVGALRFAVAQFTTCASVSAVVALVVEPAPFTGLDAAVVPLLYGGIISVGVAYTLQVIGQREALASHAALIMSSESLFGALGGALILGEDMGPRGYLGAALMLLGIGISQAVLPARPLPGPVTREDPSEALT